MGDRAMARACDSRTVGGGVAEGNAELDDVGSGSHAGAGQGNGLLDRWVSRAEIRHERLLAACEDRFESVQDEPPTPCLASRSRIVAKSLSPRPESPSRMTAGLPRSLASWRAMSPTRAKACAVSSAGMIPSVRATRDVIATASSSVAERYAARPVCFSHECSGPTPG